MKSCLYYVILYSSICLSEEQSDCRRLHPNPCCYNQDLDEANNTCTECSYGSYGWNCKLSCISGYYGRLCSYPCECINSKCHHVTGCTTTYDPKSGSTSATDATSHHNPLTIASGTGEVSTHQDIKRIGQNLHIHHEDVHASPMSTLGFSLLGSLSSLFVIGCVLFIHSPKKKWKFRGSPSFSRIRKVLLPCVNQYRQRESNQEYRDIELSNVNRSPMCGQEEDDSPYSEIRYSQLIGEASTGGASINTASCSVHMCNFDKHPDKSEKQNIYQKSTGNNEYDHINLKMKSSDIESNKNLCLTHYSDEEYVSLLKPSLEKEVQTKDDLKCQNLTLLKHTTNDLTEKDKSENKPHRLMTEYSLQILEFEMEVEVDQLSEKTKHQSVDNGKQTGPQSGSRPYSMAGGLSKTDLSKTVDLPNINISETKNFSENDLSEVVEDSVNQLDIDIPGKRENTSRRENNGQTNTKPYSIAKIPEF